jgi:hypothetical protein
VYKKGSVVFRKYATEDLEAAGNGSKGKRVEAGRREDVDKESAVPESVSKTHAEKMMTARRKTKVVTMHVDIIRDNLSAQSPWLRTGKSGQLVEDTAGMRRWLENLVVRFRSGVATFRQLTAQVVM